MSNTYAVVLAGGSGTRFWPASRRSNPKQLLSLGPDEGALIVQAVRRLERLCQSGGVLVATGQHLLAATRRVLDWLPERSFLAEPFARNTAPCIAWAAERVARADPEGVVIVVPSDQHVGKVAEYQQALSAAVDLARQGKIATLGIEPTRPETGYGYIKAESTPLGAGSARGVERFVEKPSLAKAEQYLAHGGYYWNAGIFVFQAGVMLQKVAQHLPSLHDGLQAIREASEISTTAEAEAVHRVFESTEGISIDYGVMEKLNGTGEIAVVPADVGWSDIGSFQAAWELRERDSEENAQPASTISVRAQRNLVMDLRQTPAERVVALVDVDDLCVIQTDDALLVVPRSKCQNVREVVAKLKEQGRDSLL